MAPTCQALRPCFCPILLSFLIISFPSQRLPSPPPLFRFLFFPPPLFFLSPSSPPSLPACLIPPPLLFSNPALPTSPFSPPFRPPLCRVLHVSCVVHTRQYSVNQYAEGGYQAVRAASNSEQCGNTSGQSCLVALLTCCRTICSVCVCLNCQREDMLQSDTTASVI